MDVVTTQFYLYVVEKYCALTGRWSAAPDMYAPRSNFAAAVLDRMIFVVGGFNGETVYIYRPQRKCGKVIFSQACVKNSVRGGCLPQCMLGYTPPGRHPPDRHPPECRHTPLGRHPPRTVRILLECILVLVL